VEGDDGDFGYFAAGAGGGGDGDEPDGLTPGRQGAGEGGGEVEVGVFREEGHDFGCVEGGAAADGDDEVGGEGAHFCDAGEYCVGVGVGGDAGMEHGGAAVGLQDGFDFGDDAVLDHGGAAGDDEGAAGGKGAQVFKGAAAADEGLAAEVEFFHLL